MKTIEVVHAVTRAQLKAFFAFSEKCGYSKHESEYLSAFASPALNPIVTDKREYMYAVSDGSVIGRIVTWKDAAYEKATGDNCGFFALCDMTEPKAVILIDAMLELQCKWGSARVLGPVSPDGSGFFNGLPDDEVISPFNTPYTGVIRLDEFGFDVCASDELFAAHIKENKLLEKAAYLAEKRFGITARKLKKGLFSDRLENCVYQLAPDYLKEATVRQARRIAPYIMREHSYGAYDKDGNCTGYLLTLRGILPRVTTLITGGNAYSGASASALIGTGLRNLLDAGHCEVEISVINSANARSLNLLNHAQCVKKCEYLYYTQCIQ